MMFSKAQSHSIENPENLLNHKIYILSQKRIPELALNCLLTIIIIIFLFYLKAHAF